MKEYTFIRVEVDTRLAARVLRRVPGVSVAEERTESPEAGEVPAEPEAPSARVSPGETPPPSEPDAEARVEAEDRDEGGLSDRLPPVVREWGLLVVGVLFLVVGVTSAVLWWVLRRRTGEAGAADEWTERDGVDGPVDEWRPTSDEEPAEAETSAPEAADATRDADGDEREPVDTGATVLGEEPTASAPSLGEAGVDVQVSSGADEAAAAAEEQDREPDRTAGSIDVAPLLGMTFLAVAAALVRWAQQAGAGEA